MQHAVLLGFRSYFFYEKIYIQRKELTMETTIETTGLPKLMSIREVARTGIIPEHALRRLIKSGEIPCIYSGRKALLSFGKVCEILENGELR